MALIALVPGYDSSLVYGRSFPAPTHVPILHDKCVQQMPYLAIIVVGLYTITLQRPHALRALRMGHAGGTYRAANGCRTGISVWYGCYASKTSKSTAVLVLVLGS